MDSVSTPIETKVSSDLLKKYNKEQLIRAFTINNFMLNVEHVALIAGDIRMYKSTLDLYKRNSAYSAPKKLSVNNSLVNKTISFLYPKLFANRIKGVVPVDEDGRLKVAIFKDHELSSKTNIMKVLEKKLGKKYPYLEEIRKIYNKMEEGDGQGWITLDAYRIFKVRQKDWSDAQEAVYNKMFNGEKISDEEMAYFQPIKAQYAGQTETEHLNVPGFHKFSLVPLIPGMIKGTSLEKINEQLLKQNIGYALFASGNKASATLNSKGEHNNFYVTNKKDPNKRTPNVETYHTQTIFYDYLGEQTKIDEKPKERVTFSTQLRKLLFSNLFNQGVPVDYKGKDWENATEEDKIENSLTYRQSLKFKKTLQKLYDYYLEDLLNSLGAKYSEEKGFYEIDQAKLVALLEKEFDRRDLAQNVHKILEIDETTGKFRYPLDSSIARNTIESVLISIVDNKLRKQKITGDALIQVASSGFEEAGFTSLKTSNDLPSYIHEGRTLPDGTKVTSAMKVKIAFNKAYRPLLNLNHTDGKPIGTVDRLNEVIKNEKWLDLGVNRKLLTLVGVRIPVQGLNSQEFMEVYQFLPESAGSVIIVPTEIVAKSGGDFDIDKLSIFRPNIDLDFDESNEESVKLRKEYLTQLREEKNLEEALQDKSKIKDLQNKLEALKTKVILPLDIEKPTRTEEEIKAFYKEKIDKINKTIQKSWDIQSLKLEELFKSKNLSDKNIEELFDTSGDLKSTIKSLKDEIRELRNEIKSFEIGGEQKDKLNELIEQTVSEINEEIEEKEKIIQSYYSQLEKVSEKIKSLSIDKVRLKDLKEREEKRTIAQSKYTKQRREVQKEKIQELSNSRNYLKSIENDLIDIIRESLERSDRFEELMTPNGTYLFNEFKEGKRTLTNTEMFSYKENLRQFLSNLVGKETLGIAAVHNTFYQLMQEAGMYLNNNYLPNPSNKDDKYPVRLFFNHNKTANGNISLSALTTVGSNVKISEIISQMMNGYVDVAKDDWIFFVGLVKEVSSVALFMNHAGVPLSEIVAFVKNPIIKKYIKEKINSKSLFYKNATKDTIKNPTDYIRRTLFKKLGVSTNYVDKNLDVHELSIKKITKKVLEGFKGTNILDNDQEEITENKKQAQILAHFIELEELSSNLTELMGSLNADTNKAKSIYFAEETYRKLRAVKLKNLFPLDKIISIEKNSSISSFVNIENGVKRIITNLWKQVFTVGDARTLNTFLYNKLTDDFNIKGDLRGKNKEKFLKTFKNDLFQYIFQNYVFKPNSTQLISKSIKPLLDNKSDKSIRVLITDFRNKFPEIAKTNSLIEKLTYSISNNKEVGTNLVNPKLNTGKLDVSMSNELTEAFEKLLNDTNPEVVQFAKILAYIGFMQSGLNKSNISYTTVIPNEAYSPLMKDPILKFGEYLQKEESVKTLENFYKLFRRNNPNFFIGEQSFPNKEPYRFKDYEDLNKFDIFADMSNLAAAPIVIPEKEIVTESTLSPTNSFKNMPLEENIEKLNKTVIQLQNLKESLIPFKVGDEVEVHFIKSKSETELEIKSIEKTKYGYKVVFDAGKDKEYTYYVDNEGNGEKININTEGVFEVTPELVAKKSELQNKAKELWEAYDSKKDQQVFIQGQIPSFAINPIAEDIYIKREISDAEGNLTRTEPELEKGFKIIIPGHNTELYLIESSGYIEDLKSGRRIVLNEFKKGLLKRGTNIEKGSDSEKIMSDLGFDVNKLYNPKDVTQVITPTTQPSTSVEPTVSVENTFKTKIDQFTYTLNTTTGEVIHNSKTGDRLETNETQIGKVYKEYALANNYETKEFNKQNYAKVFDKVVNINNGSIVTMPNIVLLFNKETENLKNVVKSGAIVLNNKLTISQEEINSLKTQYLHLSEPGDVLYSKEGTKFTVLSKNDMYGRSLEYKVEEKMKDGSIRTSYASLNPKTTRGGNSYYLIDLSKYTIVNNKSESTFSSNGLILNTGQKEALAKFTEFLDKEKNKNFLLKGRAGTGKTTIASTMMQVAKEKGYRIFATAISDAATTNLSVLSKNTPGSNIEIYNFAAMYGLVPQYDDDGTMTGFDFPSENSQTESAPKISNSSKTILIFDEASMVSQETLSKIKKLTPDITILYMGDNAQIMPIGDTKISTVFALEDQHELTEVMRQKEDSPILNIASNIAREIDVYDSTGELKLSPILDNVYTDFNESKNSGSIVTNSKETFINEAVEDFKKYGNKQTLVITGNNDNVESLNKKIREKIVDSDEQFIIGERLMTYTKYSKFMGKNKPKIEIFNSSVVTILSVSPSNVDGVPTNELLVEYTDQKGEIKQTYMNVIHRSNIQDKNKFYANRKKLDAEYKKTRDRSILDKLNPYRQTVLVDYAYAMTAHKAQGQTVRNTYVLPVYRGFSNLEARRMFYTSITRPTDKLVIFDQKANESNTTNNFSDQPFNISSEELGLNTNVSQEDAKCNS
jgi:exodeoxyribonuclease-5